MMKTKNKIELKSFILLLVLIFGAVLPYSCTDKFEGYNTDKTELIEIGTKQLASLFSKAQYEGCNWLTTDNYARMSINIGLHLAGYMAVGFLPQENNDVRQGWTNSGFEKMYTNAIPSLQKILEITSEEEGLEEEHAVATIWKVFMMHQVTDLWGPIPYTKAGSGEQTVPYESQKDVYYLMFEDLKNALDVLNSNTTESAFGSGDIIFNGDVTRWIKFANTLRLRLAIRISNIDPEKAKQEAEAAVAGSLMETNDDDAYLAVETLDRGNGIPRVVAWYSTVMSASMESVLKGYADPRMQEFFSPVAYDESFDAEGYPEELKENIGGYHGLANGFSSAAEINLFKSYSNFGPRFQPDLQYVTPINIMHSSESHFLRAEGAWLGWNMGGTAQSFYEKGIEVSIMQWRENEISLDSIQNYINSTNLPIAPNNYGYNDPPMTDIPVKFSSDKEEQYEQIMTQKWLALFPITFEAFSEYRRTRLPNIYKKKLSSAAEISLSENQILTRLVYTDKEKAAQPEEVEKAIDLLYNGNGTDDLRNIPLWWDVNPN